MLTSDEWEALIERAERSGLTIAQMAQIARVSEHYVVARIRGRARRLGFLPPPPAKIAWRDALARAVAEDLSPRDLADRLGVPIDRVHEATRRHGVRLRPAPLGTPPSRDWRAALADPEDRALGAPALARKLGCTERTLRSAARRHGLKLKPLRPRRAARQPEREARA